MLRAYDMRRTIDNGLYWEPDAISMAYDLFTMRNGNDVALITEGYLLCPEVSIADLARFTRLRPETVEAYGALFFDVRQAFADGALGWISAQLFGARLHDYVSGRDIVGRTRRLAWLFGPKVLCSFLNGGRNGVQEVDVKKAIQDGIRGYLQKLSLINAMQCTGRGELDVQVLKLQLDDVNKEAAQKVSEQAGQSHGDEILRFLREVAVTVADPTDKRNLELPAREPRARDYLTTAETVPV
jgi:hypothetical protein